MVFKARYKSKKLMYRLFLFFFILTGILIFDAKSQPADFEILSLNKEIIVGAAQTELYLPLLQGKRVAVVANQTSVIESKIANINYVLKKEMYGSPVSYTHLIDSLLKLGISIKKIFAPEHGFRGDADAGEYVKNGIDSKSGLPVISLYGKHNKPTPDDLKNIDIVLFDIQDVGARFYTYLSTLHFVMEACAENNIDFLILDRPNPNGFYVDGPVLLKKYSSFVGMHPVPIVYGMSIAEYALMINEEGWLKNGVKCNLKFVSCKNYTHNDYYHLPIKPSPNLPGITSIYLYPSLCLFEGTIVSVGRGTKTPFELYGHPQMKNSSYEFIPQSMDGSKNPMYENSVCKGHYIGQSYLMMDNKHLHLNWLIDAYKNTDNKKDFFNGFFNRLAGNSELKQQIIKGKTEDEIRASWQKDLLKFKDIRKKHLLYQDFD
jgi:uncharacterized protein YbbC (DUF1343 family)